MIGVGLAFVNDLIARFFMKKGTNGISASFLLRQLICVAYLVILYVIGQKTAYNPFMLLIGGALGVTLPLLYFTPRLLKTAAEYNKKEAKKDG